MVIEFGLCEPLQGWSRHLGHSWSRREYLGEPEKFWLITCFEPKISFWKLRGIFSQLLTKKATWQKSTSVPILVMQCSISEIVSTSRSWLHLDWQLSGIVYFFVIVILCPPEHCAFAIRNTHGGGFFPTRTAVGGVGSLNAPTLAKVVFVCQHH